MKLKSIIVYCAVVPVIAVMTAGCENKQKIFNGKDLTGWYVYPADKSNIWSVKKDILRSEGKPNGYLRSEKDYSDYHLHLEWRWPENPTNSGVLLHTAGPDQLWPNCIEAQLMNNNAGDIYLIGPNLSVLKFDMVIATGEKPAMRVPKQMNNSSENLPGEWNSYDIFCKNDTIKLYVNGFLQNDVTQASRTSGAICLQSEGSPIEFRNIYINPLKD